MITSTRLEVRETYFDKDTSRRFGQSDWYEPFTDKLGTLFRHNQQEFGRCVSKVYVVDSPSSPLRQIGWVFEKRMRYEGESDRYIREVWVEYRRIDEFDGEEAGI